MKTISSVTSPFTVESALTGTNCPNVSDLLREQIDKLSTGARISCPFDTLMIFSSDFPESNALFAANVVAQILDQDNDGVADNTEIHEGLKSDKGFWITGGTSQETEDFCGTFAWYDIATHLLNFVTTGSFSYLTGNQYCFGLQNWHIQEENEDDSIPKKISVEEIFHWMTQYGWGTQFPDQFGSEDWSSTMCKEAAQLECVQPGWWHEENTCPSGAPFSSRGQVTVPLSGTCAEANCDCVEFFHQAYLISQGMEPGWYSSYMPKVKADVLSMLSSDFKAVIQDTGKYSLPTKLDGDYQGNPVMKSRGEKAAFYKISFNAILMASILYFM